MLSNMCQTCKTGHCVTRPPTLCAKEQPLPKDGDPTPLNRACHRDRQTRHALAPRKQGTLAFDDRRTSGTTRCTPTPRPQPAPTAQRKDRRDRRPTHIFKSRNQLLACTVCCAETFCKQRQKQTVPRTYTPLSIEAWALRYWHAAQWLTIPRKNQAVRITPFVRQLLHGESVGRRNCLCQRLAAKTRADR